jgi:hypothetical protein
MVEHACHLHHRSGSDRREVSKKKGITSLALLHASVAGALEDWGHLPDISSEEILAWADVYHVRTGQ